MKKYPDGGLFTPPNAAIFNNGNPSQQMAWAPTFNPGIIPTLTQPRLPQMDTSIVSSNDPTMFQSGMISPTAVNTGAPIQFQQNTSRRRNPRQFGNLDWNVIAATNAGLGILQGVANTSGNSQQNAILNFNAQQFNPLNYLPYTPNNTQQAQYGQQYMAQGGYYEDEDAQFLFDDDEPTAPVESKKTISETPKVQAKRSSISELDYVNQAPLEIKSTETNLYKHVQDVLDEKQFESALFFQRIHQYY